MFIRSIFAAAVLSSTFALTGCATKPAAKIDPAPPSIAVTASESDRTPGATESTVSTGAMDNAIIVGEGSPLTVGQASPVETEKGKGLDPIYFDFDAYLLGVESRDILSWNARLLNENRATSVIIEGHADERGSDDYNMALAEKRAQAVRRYLEALGVDPDRMEAVSYGEDKPAVTGHDETAWAKNRRVEFNIGN